MEAEIRKGMTALRETLELLLLLVFITFTLRFLSLGIVLCLSIFHPEKKEYYKELFGVKKDL